MMKIPRLLLLTWTGPLSEAREAFLLLQAEGEMHIEQVVLPRNRKFFVTDRAGNWGELYEQVLKTARVDILTLPEGQEGYLETNLKLLGRG